MAAYSVRSCARSRAGRGLGSGRQPVRVRPAAVRCLRRPRLPDQSRTRDRAGVALRGGGGSRDGHRRGERELRAARRIHEGMLSAIVVAYKTPAELAAAVASLRAQSRPPEEIIVVDNGSADGEPLPRLAELDGATVVRSPSNDGFGAGCNRGARTASGDELLVMNADVVLSADALRSLSDRLNSDARIAAVGPRMMSAGDVQLSARSFPTVRTGLLGRRSPLTRALGSARRHPREFRHVFGGAGDVDWVSGACMLLRGQAFREVGGFDEDYFLYWEDADLCRRLGGKGWRVAYEPAAVVHHVTGASGTTERTITAFHESAARFASRYIARSAIECNIIRGVLAARCRLALAAFRRSDAG